MFGIEDGWLCLPMCSFGVGKEQKFKNSALGLKLVALLDRPKNLDLRPSVQYCCLSTVEYESDRKLPARQKLWNWIVRSLRGNKPACGAYHYLVDEVQTYDISYLFKRLVDVLEQITICSLDDELETVIKMDYKPGTQNIFSYLGELKKAIKRLHDMNEILPLEGRIVLPDSYVRSRLIRAARQLPVYKPVLDHLLILPVEQWSKLTSEDLYHQLEAVCANELSVSASKHSSYASNNFDSLSANSLQFKQKGREKEKKQASCHAFARGKCTRDPCPYLHDTPEQETQPAQKSAPASVPPKPTVHPTPRCHKCNSTQHSARECTFNGKCTWCGRMGHKEIVCSHRIAGRPQAHLAQSDGGALSANMFCVKEKIPVCTPLHSNNPVAMSTTLCSPPLGMVREIFLADTGATRSLHPNGRSAFNFSRVSLEISTACVGNTMRSEGVGKMLLYTPEGLPVPGFEQVVFSKQCAKKLASVLCDAGLICVFDKHGLTTYEEKNVSVEGKIFTKDERDKKTRLYPLSLLRKVDEKTIANITIVPSAPPSQEKRKSEKVLEEEKLPDVVEDGDALPTVMLAKPISKKVYRLWRDIMRNVEMWVSSI